MKAAYQGTKASFSDIAIERYFGKGVEPIGKASFEDVFKSLDSGETEFAAVPIENSLIGPIVENFDLFHRYDVEIIGELCLPIEHCLVGKNTSLKEIKKVYSHPKALAQCTHFFQEHPWMEPLVHFDTAGAAQDIAARSDATLAAIGSRKTAEVYKLDVIKANLEDDESNTTRFLFLKKNGDAVLKEGKCSLLITLKHIPGALAEVLQVLAKLGLNLTQIVSRPIRAKPFEYLFFIDILFNQKHNIEFVLHTLKEKTETLKLLGIYAPSK
jgi:prephenate dehydratase